MVAWNNTLDDNFNYNYFLFHHYSRLSTSQIPFVKHDTRDVQTGQLYTVRWSYSTIKTAWCGEFDAAVPFSDWPTCPTWRSTEKWLGTPKHWKINIFRSCGLGTPSVTSSSLILLTDTCILLQNHILRNVMYTFRKQAWKRSARSFLVLGLYCKRRSNERMVGGACRLLRCITLCRIISPPHEHHPNDNKLVLFGHYYRGYGLYYPPMISWMMA